MSSIVSSISRGDFLAEMSRRAGKRRRKELRNNSPDLSLPPTSRSDTRQSERFKGPHLGISREPRRSWHAWRRLKKKLRGDSSASISLPPTRQSGQTDGSHAQGPPLTIGEDHRKTVQITVASPEVHPENVATDEIETVPSGGVKSPIAIDDRVETTPNVNSTVPRPLRRPGTLRPIAIDGSNVAFSHGRNNGRGFSCKGIQLCIDYFFRRGHKTVKVFVPHYQSTAKSQIPVSERKYLQELHRKQIVVFTPSKTIDGKLVVCYDDGVLLDYAAQSGAVVVSNDNFRDLLKEPDFVDVIKHREKIRKNCALA